MKKISWQSRVDHCARQSVCCKHKNLGNCFWPHILNRENWGRLTYAMKSSQSKPQQLDQDMSALHACLREIGGISKMFLFREEILKWILKSLWEKKANEVKIELIKRSLLSICTKLFDNQKENVRIVSRGSISKEAMPTAPQISTKMFRGLNKVLFQFER